MFFTTMTSVRKAVQKDIPLLNRKLMKLLEDKNSQVYQDNVTKFGIPEEYVREAFAEKTLLKAITSGKARFYLAFEDNEIIGFAQTVKQDAITTELDRIIVFPEHERKGIGTQLLAQTIEDLKKEGVHAILVNAGREETHARRFYEKNGFKLIEETTIQAPWGKKLDLAIYQLQLESS